MPTNLSIVLAATLQTSDTTLSPSPQIVIRSLNNPTFAAVVESYLPFAQVVNPTTLTITLPAATVFVAYVKNLSAAGNLTVNFTPTGGATQNCLLIPGGVFLYMQPATTAGGITAMSLASSAGTISAEILTAA